MQGPIALSPVRFPVTHFEARHLLSNNYHNADCLKKRDDSFFTFLCHVGVAGGVRIGLHFYPRTQLVQKNIYLQCFTLW